MSSCSLLLVYRFYFLYLHSFFLFFFFSSRRRHTRSLCDWSSDVCSSDLRGRSVVRAEFCGSCSSQIRREAPVKDVCRQRRSEERRVGKECRSRWSPDH